MEEKNTDKNQEPQKLTYERLQAIAGGLQQQNEQLKRQLDSMRQYITEQQTQSIFAYLESSFKVVNYIDLFDSDFAGVVLGDIKAIMMRLRDIIVPKDEDENEEDDGGQTE